MTHSFVVGVLFHFWCSKRAQTVDIHCLLWKVTVICYIAPLYFQKLI